MHAGTGPQGRGCRRRPKSQPQAGGASLRVDLLPPPLQGSLDTGWVAESCGRQPSPDLQQNPLPTLRTLTLASGVWQGARLPCPQGDVPSLPCQGTSPPGTCWVPQRLRDTLGDLLLESPAWVACRASAGLLHRASGARGTSGAGCSADAGPRSVGTQGTRRARGRGRDSPSPARSSDAGRLGPRLSRAAAWRCSLAGTGSALPPC